MLTDQKSGAPLVRLKEVLPLVGVGRQTLMRWVKQGRFPAPVRIGPRAIAWKREDLTAWLQGLERVA